jgi:porphobilinogen synthase
MSNFPELRLRRLRRTEGLRKLVQETNVSVGDLVYPLFIVEGHHEKQEIASMPGISRFSLDMLQKEVEELAQLGIPAVILFGIPKHKDETGSEAYNPEGVVQKAIQLIKKNFPEMIVVNDVCLCEYTCHGHCGVVVNGYVDNDKTLEILAKTAVSYAQAGADIVAPSDMMDGRVGAIRKALDNNGFPLTSIFAYSAKYASGFYDSFREAADCAPQFGNRRAYQMDPPNWREALREVELDIAEGADIVMVKPALPYLDILRKVRDTFNYPLGAYNVSGEFAMIKAAAQAGWLDERRVVTEVMTSIKRAGADIIITYHAKDFARWQAAMK